MVGWGGGWYDTWVSVTVSQGSGGEAEASNLSSKTRCFGE